MLLFYLALLLPFLSKNIEKIPWFHYIPISASIISVIVASTYALVSLKITRRYYYVLSTGRSNKIPLIDIVNKFKGLYKEKSLDNFIDVYMFSTENNALHNEQRALYILTS